MKKRGDRAHTTRGRGGSPGCAGSSLGPQRPGARRLLHLARTRHPSLGFILSPSATLRVAGLAPWVKVEHTTV